MKWEWLGNRDAPRGIATYWSTRSEIVIPLPSFADAFALARLMDEVHADGGEASRDKIRARFQTMIDET